VLRVDVVWRDFQLSRFAALLFLLHHELQMVELALGLQVLDLQLSVDECLVASGTVTARDARRG
jgi:hypothetical protein